MKEKTDELHESYIKKFSELKEHSGVMTPEAYTAMTENLLKEYSREYATMDGQAGIETDKSIEVLSTQSDRELKQLRLEHERQSAELKLASDRLKYETELKGKIAAAKAELLSDELVPADVRGRWWQLWRKRPNYAKQLMLREVAAETDEYFAGRLNEVEAKENGAADIEEMLQAALPQPRGRRARRRHDERIHEVAVRLEEMLRNAATAIQDDPDMADVYGMPE